MEEIKTPFFGGEGGGGNLYSLAGLVQKWSD